MTDSRQEVAPSSAADSSWVRLSDGLIGGIHHTLNNRMAAMSAVAQIVESDLPEDHPLTGSMLRELRRFESSVTLLTLLMGSEGAEPVQVETIVAGAARLFEMHHSMRDLQLRVEMASELYPLYLEASALRRALMIVLAVASRRARAGNREVVLEVVGDERAVVITVSAVGDADAPDGESLDATLAGISPEGAAALLERWGGSLQVHDSGGEIVLQASLPTLPEARKRQQAGS